VGVNASAPTRLLRDFVTSTVAACAAVTVTLVAKVVFGVPTLPELAQDKLIQSLPGPVFAFMLRNLLYLGKPMFFISLLVLQVVVLAIVGVAALRWRRPLEAAGAIWLLVGLVMLPLLGRGVFDGSFDVALVNLLAVGVFAGVLIGARRDRWPLKLASTEEAVPGKTVVQRRELLAGGLLVLASAVLTKIAIGDLPQRPGINPDGLPEPITPSDQFYIVSKNLFDPEVDAGGWKLRVDGMVDTPLTLSLADIESMPSEEFVRTLECISNEVGGDLISTGRFTGVRLSEVLKRAGARRDAAMLHFTSEDDYTESMPMAKALDSDTFLVYKLNGRELPKKHGYPLRVLGAGTYGMKNPKWLRRIEVNNAPADGFWEAQGWTPDAIVQTMSRIDSPRRKVDAGEVRIQGIAFGGDRGISAVELSRDKRKTWLPARLVPALGPLTWVFWQFDTTLAADDHDYEVRAVDGKGQPQTVEFNASFPSGATGYHGLKIRVTDPAKKEP
jgi:DMSO/TMAO reductase YedYZ molybdopterin-dependent catalytic subunit